MLGITRGEVRDSVTGCPKRSGRMNESNTLTSPISVKIADTASRPRRILRLKAIAAGLRTKYLRFYRKWKLSFRQKAIFGSQKIIWIANER